MVAVEHLTVLQEHPIQAEVEAEVDIVDILDIQAVQASPSSVGTEHKESR